jgi:hypothetical protein
MLSPQLAALYPNLVADGGKKTSEKDPVYNCISWAAKRDKKWWWQPGGGIGIYWPPDVLDDFTFECFVQLFEKLGYEKSLGYELEVRYEKVAIYAHPNGEFSHVAKQQSSGKWTSKLGPDEDVRHNSPYGLEGHAYGNVRQILRKRCNLWGKIKRGFFTLIYRLLLKIRGNSVIGVNS